MTRPNSVVGIILASVLLSLIAWVPLTTAQGQQSVEGGHDFRELPVLVDGTFTDTVLTGETVFYAVRYRSGDAYVIDVELDTSQGVNGLQLMTRLIDPEFTVVEEATTSLTGSADFATADVARWYLSVRLTSNGRVGVGHPITIDLVGFDPDRNDCVGSPACLLDDRLAMIDTQIFDAEAAAARLLDGEDVAVVQDQIDSAQAALVDVTTNTDLANGDRERSVARIAELCAPDPTCASLPDKEPKTPVWAWGVGGLVFATGAAVAGTKGRRTA